MKELIITLYSLIFRCKANQEAKNQVLPHGSLYERIYNYFIFSHISL